MLASMVVASLLEGIGIAVLLPLLNLVVDEAKPPNTSLARGIVNIFDSVGLQPTVGSLLLMVVVLITAKSFALLLVAKQISYTASLVTMRLRMDLLARFMDARWSFFVRQRAGSLSASLTTEPNRASTTYLQTARALTGSIQILVYLALSFAISLQVSLAAILVGVGSAVLLHRFVVVTGRTGRRQTMLTKSLLSNLLDGLHAMKPIKAMAQEHQLSQMLSGDIEELAKAQRQMVMAREQLQIYREPITAAALATGLFLILTLWQTDLETLIVMAFLFLRIVGRVAAMQGMFQTIAGSLPAFWFVRSVLAQANNSADRNDGTRPAILGQGIRLDEVSFSYGKTAVLRDLSLDIPFGSFTAIIGPSGSGKTTIADVITGLQRPTRGRVLVDGVPLSEIDQHRWRSIIGYVPQDSVLFHDTVLNNVTLRAPDITEAHAKDALVRAGVWAFVSGMTEGIHSMVGERGTRLSGGQKQRIALARALARNPKLLILDEATTALDPSTEAEICDMLVRLRGEVTILAISHQPALQRVADNVYLVESGSAVRQPTHPNRRLLTTPASAE
ncbi:MAG: ABC transporter ATP-binding protein [Kiloniellaceae bacterium]